VVWNGRDLADLKDFWKEDSVNYAMPGTDDRGLNALRSYRDSFFDRKIIEHWSVSDAAGLMQ
jgi:hypothetical protein